MIPIVSFKAWWEDRLPQETRKNVRRAGRRGVTVRTVAFDDDVAQGLKNLYDETPTRQGRPFWHYGKEVAVVKRENQTFSERSEYLGAYYNEELIGFMRMIYVDQTATIMAVISKPSAASRSTRVQAVGRKARNDPQMREEFLESAPETLETLWKPIKGLITERGNLSHLKELSATMRPLTATAALVGLPAFARMAAACEALFNDLLIKPQHVTPSVLLTIAQALDTLKFLFRHPDSLADKPPSAARILVVDDDVFTRQAVTRALQNVHLTVKCVDNAVSALKRRVGAHFDLILLDIEMPGANGFDLCTQLRAVPAHGQTPIVFLSMHADVAHRVESMLRGGDDFITKPFLFMELAVKALSYVIKGRVKQTGANCDSNGDDAASGFSRRDLDALKHAVLASLDRK